MGGPSKVTFELGLKHESEPGVNSARPGAIKGAEARRDLAGRVSSERPVWGAQGAEQKGASESGESRQGPGDSTGPCQPQ